jgi:uncharacterized membrane protein YvbJ
MICRFCLAENKDDVAFCTSCGKKLVPVATQPIQDTVTSTKKHGLLFWIAIIIGILLMLICLGYIILIAFIYGMPG